MDANFVAFTDDPSQDEVVEFHNPELIFQIMMGQVLSQAMNGDKVLVKVVLSDDTGFFWQFNRGL